MIRHAVRRRHHWWTVCSRGRLCFGDEALRDLRLWIDLGKVVFRTCRVRLGCLLRFTSDRAKAAALCIVIFSASDKKEHVLLLPRLTDESRNRGRYSDP